MDRDEARRLLVTELAEYRKLSYGELVRLIGEDRYIQVNGPSNKEYQIEIQFLWDNKEGGDIRVLAAIDDGSLRGSFRPVCEDLLVHPDTPP